ncbi:MAG TPA: CPBP family intramembrane glutamic endopeptidase [Candidatus Acidoferrales bacterium]
MAYNDNSPSGAAPARARSNEPPDSASHDAFGEEPPAMDQLEPRVENAQDFPAPPQPSQPRPGVSDDLLVPWGWQEVALFVILLVIGGVLVTRGMAEIAVRFLGVDPNDMFGEAMSTAKSVVVLLSQAILDCGAILYLYLMLLARTDAPFWPTIGWREMRPGTGRIRESAMHFLAGGAMLAVVVTFVGGFLNSKGTLPIEELLKARVSIVLFGVMGVLVAPLVEETIFRGFLYPVIARRIGVAAGIAITGLLFGLMHAAQLGGAWGQIALLILVGVILTWVRARTGTVAASFFVHLGYNGLQLAGYVIYMVSGSHH